MFSTSSYIWRWHRIIWQKVTLKTYVISSKKTSWRRAQVVRCKKKFPCTGQSRRNSCQICMKTYTTVGWYTQGIKHLYWNTLKTQLFSNHWYWNLQVCLFGLNLTLKSKYFIWRLLWCQKKFKSNPKFKSQITEHQIMSEKKFCNQHSISTTKVKTKSNQAFLDL